MNLSTLKWRLKRILWDFKHSNGSTRDFYKDQVKQRLNLNEDHQTLGKNYTKKGESTFEFLREEGILPNHKVVDYGCGSLRIGQHFISYLDKSCYVGMDITSDYYQKGIESLTNNILDQKTPEFYVISDSTIEQVAQFETDYLFSVGVLIHVPKNELKDYLTNMNSILTDETIGYLSFRHSDTYQQMGSVTWHYPPGYVREFMSSMGFKSVEILEKSPDPKATWIRFKKIS